ncbi:uncharacterized protein LOC116802422 isoform X2 [Drosophila sechellia]|uniref:uncharacterized protein LOC116802422 isoform X2 n=1 Tax=Drosophila sechellia TaxID=7238 RepID=UPI0013DDF4AF|nr:uncharacterized protein LOC116802422 isoform X2 [Drosophila sechellia]
MEDQLRILMEHQNQSFLELAKTLQASVREPAQNGVVTLPKFNADIPGADATQWCFMVDIIVAEKPLEGSALILALTKSLEGSASQWLSEVCYAGVTWLEFKQLFQQRYANAETSAAMFLQLLNSRPGNSECLAIYASRMVTSLVCKWKGLDTERIAVSVVLGHLANFDRRLQRIAYTAEIKNRRDLQAELQVFAFDRRTHHSGNEESGGKRAKFALLKCHLCGKMGHKMIDCRNRKQSAGMSRQDHRGSQSFQQHSKGSITCYRCQEQGHIASQCPKNMASGGAGFRNEKRAELCVVDEPKTSMLLRE